MYKNVLPFYVMYNRKMKLLQYLKKRAQLVIFILGGIFLLFLA